MKAPHHVSLFALLSLCITMHCHSQNAIEKPGESLATLMSVLQATDLLDVLEDKGAFTVFAPSDAAFFKMGEDQIRRLLQPENHHQLKSLLAYHIVAGKFTAARILQALCEGQGAATFTTVQGEELLATIEGTDIVLTDCSGNKARITTADRARRNMVFHHIDTVITPGP